MGLMNRMKQLGWKERIVDGRRVWISPPKRAVKKERFPMSEFRKRQRVPAHVSDVTLEVVDQDFQSVFPAIFEFLCVLPDDAGPQAKTASLTMFTEDGLFKVCLSDRVSGLVCFFSADTFKEVLEALEAGLCHGSADWRSPRKGKR